MRISFPHSGDDVYVEVCCERGLLTFEIKLLDVFQRLVDKVETSQSLREETSMCEIGHVFRQRFHTEIFISLLCLDTLQDVYQDRHDSSRISTYRVGEH